MSSLLRIYEEQIGKTCTTRIHICIEYSELELQAQGFTHQISYASPFPLSHLVPSSCPLIFLDFLI